MFLSGERQGDRNAFRQGVETHHYFKKKGNLLQLYLQRDFSSFKALALMAGDFPPLVMIMFILYYLLHSDCITKVIQNLIRAAMEINEVTQQINGIETLN